MRKTSGLRGLLLLPILPAIFRLYAPLLRRRGTPPAAAEGYPRRRILVVNLTAHIGDIVMCLPLLERLHAEQPEALLECAVAAPMGSLLRSLPFLEQVHELRFGPPRPPLVHLYRRIATILRYVRGPMSGGRYDLCLLPRWGTDPNGSAYLAFLTGAPVRWGQDPHEEVLGVETFPGTRLLMTSALRGGQGLPEAVRQLRLLPAAGLSSPIDEQAEEKKPITALQQIATTVDQPALWLRLGIAQDSRLLVIAPGASSEHRRWPLERFVETVQPLRKAFGLTVVAVGAPSEQALGQNLEKLSEGGIRSLIGKTTLQETIALLAAARLFLGNDSGPAHIAGGLGTPTVVLSPCPLSARVEGPSSPSRVRPVGPEVVIVQPPTGLDPCTDTCIQPLPHCILQITPSVVIEQGMRLLDSEREPIQSGS